MKKVLFYLMSCLLLSSCLIELDDETGYSLRENSQDVVIFLHSPTCAKSCSAKEYIEKTYPSAQVRYVDIDLQSNIYLLKAAKQDYGVGDSEGFIQTPVICFGPQYIEGWDYDKRVALDGYIQRYLPKEE